MTDQKRAKRTIIIDFNKFFLKNWQFFVVFIFGMILSLGVWTMMSQIVRGDEAAFHVARLQAATNGWANGQIVPQVDPKALDGLGYAYNLFHGPLPTYAAAGIQALVGSWPMAINLVLILCLIGAGFTMCYCLTKISKNQVLATLVSVFYMSTPYVLSNLYTHLALDKLAVMAVAPIFLLGLYQLSAGKKHASRSIALSLSLMILSQSAVAALFGLVVVIYMILNWRKALNWENIWRVLMGVIVALGLSAFFTLPLFEAKLADIPGATFAPNAQTLNDQRILPQQLLTGTGDFGMALGIVALIGLVGFWFARTRIENDNQQRWVTTLYIIAVLALLLATPLVNWTQMPTITWQIQSPQQFLTLAAACLAVVSGYTIYGLLRGLSDEKQGVAMAVASVLAVYAIVPSILLSAEHYANLGELTETSSGAIAERSEEIRIISGDVMLHQANKDGLNIGLTLENLDNESVVVELPMTYYPGYQAEMNNMNLQVSPSREDGLVTVTVPSGASGDIKVKYGLSLATQIGGLVSVATAALGAIWVLISGVIDHHKRKKQAEVSRLMDSVREVVGDDMLEAEFKLEADKDEILASMGEPKMPTMPVTTTITPPDLPIPQAMKTESPIEPVALTETPDIDQPEPKSEEPKPAQTAKATTKVKATNVRKTRRADTTKDATKAARKTSKKTAQATTTKAKTNGRVATDIPRRTTTTRVRTVHSDELEDA